MTTIDTVTKSKIDAIDVQSGDRDDHALDVDAATDVAAKFFNDLPLRVSFSKAAYIEAQANMAMRLDGAEVFTNAAILRTRPGRDVADENEDDTSASRTFIRAAMDELKRTREREREEWARTRSSVGGVTMTGTEWAALSRLMRSDAEFRQKLLDAFMARGMTLDEAEKRYDRVAEVAGIAAIPPAQRTEDQKRIIGEANADPEFRQDVEQAQTFSNDQAEPNADTGLISQFQPAVAGVGVTFPTTTAIPDRRITLSDGPAI